MWSNDKTFLPNVNDAMVIETPNKEAMYFAPNVLNPYTNE